MSSENSRPASTSLPRPRVRLAVPLLALATAACTSEEAGTFLVLHIERGSVTEEVRALDVELRLAGQLMPESRQLTEPGGAPIALPTSVTFRFASAAGPVEVIVLARNAAGDLLSRGTSSALVERRQTRTVTVVLGMQTSGLDGGGQGSDAADASAGDAGTADASAADTGPALDADGSSPDSGAGADAAPPARLQLNPDSIRFNPLPYGQSSAPVNVRVDNSGGTATGPLTVTIDDPAHFDLNTLGNACGAGLAPGAGCSFQVAFRPQAPAGQKRANVTVMAQAPGPSVTLPVVGEAIAPGNLTVNPSMHDFGVLAVGAMSPEQVFTVRNTGGDAIANTLMAGLLGDGFSLGRNTCGRGLAAGASCEVGVVFSPRAVGQAMGSLSITAGDQRAVASLGGTGSAVLTVQRAGNGMGTVTSIPVGVSCGATCTAVFSAPVTLFAEPAPSSTFTGWSGGGCSGTMSCMPALSGPTTVTATFALRSIPLTVAFDPAGNGSGLVTSMPAGISCGSACQVNFNHGTVVTLTATPDASSTFEGWSGGGCTGTGTCSVTLTEATSVFARFVRRRHTLTLTRQGNGFGLVRSSPGGIDCGPTCTASFDHGTVVALTATASTSPESQRSNFTGWSGGGCPATGTCNVTMNGPVSVTARFELAPNFAFVTSTTHTGNLGGLAGADMICQQRAMAANRPGTYRAWLSTPMVSAASRLQGAGGWVRTDGRPFVNSLMDLTAGRMFHPLRLDEAGREAPGQTFTATMPDGTADTTRGNSCSTWQAASGMTFVLGGLSSGMGGMWTELFNLTCAASAQLYCFGVDRNTTVAPPAPSGPVRYAFVTSEPWLPGGGLASADMRCQSEAQAAGLPGMYRALLATTMGTVASRFATGSGSAPWARPDGVLIAPTAAALFTSDWWTSAPNMTANRMRLFGADPVWSGTYSVTTIAVGSVTCNDWTTSSAGVSGIAGRAGATQADGALGGNGTQPCNSQGIHLRCLQL